MKAAVILTSDGRPQLMEWPEPVTSDKEQMLVRVKAVALKHLDKARASGNHYSSHAAPGGRVVGGDGVCLLADGSRVYAIGDGMMAEQALIDRERTVPIPQQLDDATAAALPNAVVGAAMGLRFKADLQPGDVVLINGATGFTGRVAVQLARHYGAKKIIATGRNETSLQELLALGADEVLPLHVGDEIFRQKLAKINAETPFNVVLDYLWGPSAGLILTCLKGNGAFTNRVRYVSVGAISGDLIQLSSEILRSTNLQLTGSGLGAWTREQVGLFFSDILPEAFDLAVQGQIRVETFCLGLENLAELWSLDMPGGRRPVVLI